MHDYSKTSVWFEHPNTETREQVGFSYDADTGRLSLQRPVPAGTNIFIDYVTTYKAEQPDPNAPRISKHRGNTRPASSARSKRAAHIKAAKQARKQGRR